MIFMIFPDFWRKKRKYAEAVPSTIYAGSVECAPFFVSKDSSHFGPAESRRVWTVSWGISIGVKHHDSWLQKKLPPKQQIHLPKTMEPKYYKIHRPFHSEHVFSCFFSRLFLENKHLVYWMQYAPPPPYRPPHQATQLLVPEKWASGGKCLGQGGISCQNNRALSDAEMRHMCNGKNPKVLIEKHVQNYKHV